MKVVDSECNKRSHKVKASKVVKEKKKLRCRRYFRTFVDKRIETEASEIKDEDLDNRAKTKIKKTMLKKKIRKTKILKIKLRSKQRNSFPVENAENYSEVESE